MSIRVTCSAGHTLTIADTWAGRTGRCPVCKAPVQVPAAPAPPEAGAEPPPAEQLIVRSEKPLESPTDVVSQSIGDVPETLDTSHSAADEPRKALAPVTQAPLPPPLPQKQPITPPGELIKAAVAEFVVERGEAPAMQTVAASAPVGPPPIIDTAPSPATAPSAPVTVVADSPSSATASSPQTLASRLPSSRGYQPDADKRWTVYYLAAGMGALGLFCTAPAFVHWNLAAAPNWARAVWLLSLLQLAYAVWAASIPDWTTLWSSMIVHTIVAASYGLVMTIALTTPSQLDLPLDLTDVRREAVLWCAGVMLLACLVAYLCGRAAWRWRRMFELLHA